MTLRDLLGGMPVAVAAEAQEMFVILLGVAVACLRRRRAAETT